MNSYETVVACTTQMSEKEIDDLHSKLKKLIADHQGDIEATQPMGRRTLAYPIAKQKDGNYYCYAYRGDCSLVGALERSLRLDERILRYLTVRRGEVKRRPKKKKKEASSSDMMQRKCRFCNDPNWVIDYKDPKSLRSFVTERGRILPRRMNGNCSSHQRWTTQSIKYARVLSLLHFTSSQVS